MLDQSIVNGNLLLHTDPENPAMSLCISRTDVGQRVPLAQICMFQGVLSFRTMNSGGALEEYLRIHTNGNVGIGTNAPTQKLEVGGTVKATAFQGNGAGLTNVSGTDATKVSKSGDTMTGVLNLPANGLTVGASQLVVSGGNVGIGTSSPKAALEVNGSLAARRLTVTDLITLGDNYVPATKKKGVRIEYGVKALGSCAGNTTNINKVTLDAAFSSKDSYIVIAKVREVHGSFGNAVYTTYESVPSEAQEFSVRWRNDYGGSLLSQVVYVAIGT